MGIIAFIPWYSSDIQKDTQVLKEIKGGKEGNSWKEKASNKELGDRCCEMSGFAPGVKG